jgi:hypothetical protein
MARLSFRRWWHKLRPGPWRVVLVVPEADRVPDDIPSNGAVLIRSSGSLKWLAFDCPCGRGHRVMLNLDSSRWPCWQVEAEAPLTLWPSVDVVVNSRRCHYVIFRGRIEWVRSLASWQVRTNSLGRVGE